MPGVAQDAYPARPITMVVPFAAGGASDVIARLIAEQMGQALGQRLVIENVVGAGGATAMTRAARATADGYTIVIGNSGTATAVYALYPDIKFTPDDFAPIGIVAKTSPIIALKKDLPAKTLREFIDYAKKNPGKATLGHAGVGSSNYLICKAFVQAAGPFDHPVRNAATRSNALPRSSPPCAPTNIEITSSRSPGDSDMLLALDRERELSRLAVNAPARHSEDRHAVVPSIERPKSCCTADDQPVATSSPAAVVIKATVTNPEAITAASAESAATRSARPCSPQEEFDDRHDRLGSPEGRRTRG